MSLQTSSPDALGAIQYMSLRVRPYWEPQVCAGVFSIWSLRIFWCFDEVAIHHLNESIGGRGFWLWACVVQAKADTPLQLFFLLKVTYKVATEAENMLYLEFTDHFLPILRRA